MKSTRANVPEAPTRETLAEVKELLLRGERSRLDRLEKKGVSAEAIAHVLPDAILAREAQDDRIARALAPTVEAGLFRSARRDPQALADAIHPALGPAIRSMIQASLRQSLESLNVALENSLSPKGIGWRLEAARTGKTFSEVVLLKTLVFRVDQVLLVDRDSGLIMAEVHPPGLKTQDADMVAGMLSAIREFAADSFGASPDESPLEEIEFQDLTLILAQGPEAILALVVRGNPPRTLHERAVETVEALHVEYGPEMNAFDGEAEALAPIHPLLEDLLEQEARKRRPNPWIRLIPLLAAVGFVALGSWAMARSFLANRDLGRAEEALRRTPGVIVTEADLDGGDIVVRGLADPLVKDPERIARAALGRSKRGVRLEFGPFTSLDEAIVLQRLRKLVSIPAGVGMDLRQGRLRLSGLDPAACEDAAAALRALRLELLGIESVIVRS
ncbi:hypothetical protein Poly30_26150 [Planctomycetes bacterium Poly30]|uniref:Uncharacterized protein n=1 Tax=Saltatorellus ferox TaxID=2528018 RepID=A0A518ESN3_9BACT|nr:hypothetical protein Poly30_26150 [Planctomycetes bacterium Poly30]